LRAGLPATLVAALFVIGSVVGTASSAIADEPAPAPLPTPAATFTVAPPSQQQIDDARRALERVSQQGTRAPATLAEVADPTAQSERETVVSRIKDQDWWTIAAALLVLVVASEGTRVGVRRARHRGPA
jgi:hypothetical protein